MRGAWIEVWRGPLVESRHRLDIAVVDADGTLRARAGDPALVTFARSAVKPLQALPVVADGAADRFALTARELAVCCASHNGEALHVETVSSILRKLGLDERALACGAQRPMREATARALDRAGREHGRIHNNCSGKHAGMLALARLHGWPVAGYVRPDHPVQRRMRDEIARWTGMAPDDMPVAVDGCGVSTFALPLSALAGAFARLAAAARREGRDGAAGRILGAMTAHPELVAGTDRLCTELMRVARGRIIAKVGAEGVYCAGVPGAELGVAIKVEDGARRAAEPALLGVLRSLGLLSDEEIGELARWAEPALTNSCGEDVGRIRATIELEPSSDGE